MWPQQKSCLNTFHQFLLWASEGAFPVTNESLKQTEVSVEKFLE